MTSVDSKEMTLIGPGRRESIVGETVTEIFEMIDFPAPVAGVITLPSGKYVIKNSLSTSDRFLIAPGAAVTWTMEDQRFNVFTYAGTGVLFSALDFTRFNLTEINTLLIGNGAQLFDTENGDFVFRSGQILFGGTGAIVGSAINGGFRIDDMFTVGFSEGIVFGTTPYGLVTETIMVGAPGGSGTYISIIGDTGFFAMETGNVAITTASESVFYIEPTIVGPVNIANTISTGPGSFYESGDTGPIASFTDVSTGNTAVSVTDDGGDALFTSAGHGLNVGETAEQTTFSESSYNGDHVVTEATTDTYKLGLAYVSDDSGLFATTTCQVDDMGHGLSDTQTLSIFETINFGGGYRIFNAQTDTFEITLGKAFPGSETTGNWDTGSLEGSNSKRSKYVDAFRNGAQPASSNIGSFVVGGNTEDTNIAEQGVFVDLNLNAMAVEASDNELWTLIDSTTGAIRYDGLTPDSLNYHGLVAASSLGGAQQFDFRLLRNRDGEGFADLPSPDDVDVPIGVGSALQSTPLGWAIEVEPGDIYKLQVANMVGVFDIKINTLKIIID